MNSDNIQVHIKVIGKVQKVGFRYFAIEQAEKYKIKGWVRNRKDHSVEVLAEGPKAAIDNFMEAIKVGPRLGNVKNIELKYQEFSGEYKKFKFRLTK